MHVIKSLCICRNVTSLKEKVQQQGLQLQEVTGSAEAASKENDELKRSHRREMEALKLRTQEEVGRHLQCMKVDTLGKAAKTVTIQRVMEAR